MPASCWRRSVPELRQYIVAGNDEERPFSRDQRRWVYASSKLQNNYFGFGTDNDMEHSSGNVIIHHRTFGEEYPTHGAVGQEARLPSAKVLGGPRDRRHAFRPKSVVNISAMSFGSLSGSAIEAINRGAMDAGCLHNTGEGAVSPYHRQGGELVFQIGTAYFGCRDEKGRFSLPRLKELVDRRTDPGVGDQAQPGCEARARRRAAGGEGLAGDLRDARRPDGPGLPQPLAARGVRRRGLDARLRRDARRRDRAAGRDQVGRRRPRLLGGPDRADGARARGASTSSPSTAARAAPVRRR